MICAVEYQKLYVSERFVHCPDDHYLIVLNKSPCLYSFEGKSYCADAEHIVCCRPGEEITVEATEEYLTIHGRPEDYKEMKPADVAYYDGCVYIDLSTVESTIALPMHPSHAITIRELLENPKDIGAW